MANNSWKLINRLFLIFIFIFLLLFFVLWRFDNQRVERFRTVLLDNLIPNISFIFYPIKSVGAITNDFKSYFELYRENKNLKNDLQNMKNWKEAALQLQVQNTQLRALNNLKLSPKIFWITGEIIADSGSPFNQSGLINIGSLDGIEDGSAVVDGVGLIGRISGIGNRTARVIFLSDANSSIPVVIRSTGQKAILNGDNSKSPLLKFISDRKSIKPGYRVVTSGDGGVLPPDILIGTVAIGKKGKLRVILSAKFEDLNFVRVLETTKIDLIEKPGEIIKKNE